MADKEKAPVKMGIQEKKALEKVVDAEYAVLSREMDQYSAELIRARQQEIEEEYAIRQEEINTFTRQWDDLRTQWQEQYREFVAGVRAQGLDVTADRYGRGRLLEIGTPVFTIPGKQAALENVDRDVRLQMSRAKTSLERQRVQTNRQILVTGLAEEASALLTRMPDPRELVVQALQESQNPRLALTLGIAARVVPEAAQDQGGDIVEGLVVHEAENMADRG